MNDLDYQQRLPPPESTFLQNVLRYIAVFIKYKALIIAVTAAVAAVAIAVSAASLVLPPGKNPLPNVYTAEATVLVQSNPYNDITSNILSSLTGRSGESAAPIGFEYSALVLQMLQSRVILDQVALDLDFANRYKLGQGDRAKFKARDMIEGKSHFTYAKSSGTITISYRDTDPVFASQVVNRMVLLLNDWFDRMYGASTQKQKDTLQQKMTEVKDQITSLQDQIKTLQKEYGFLTIQELGPSQADAAQQFANLKQELDVQEGIYNTLSHQYELARLSIDPTPSFQVLEMAEVPGLKSGPNRTSIIVMSTLIAFCASLVLSLIVNGVSKVRKDPQVRRILKENR
jgi:tyrosine-protein kinase Etk/Wzc